MARQKDEEEERMIREAERQRALREELAIDLYRERRNSNYQQSRRARARANRQEASRPRSDKERRRLTFGVRKQEESEPIKETDENRYGSSDEETDEEAQPLVKTHVKY